MSTFLVRDSIKFASTLLCGIALAAAPSAAAAGNLQVDPIRVEISADRKTASIRVRNEDSVPVVIRAYPLAWAQVVGEDVYSETSDLILSPPVFTIAPGKTQLVRVGLRVPSSESKPYRIIIEEIPQARQGGGIQVALRLNLPMFVNMSQGSADAISWSAVQEVGGSWTVEAANTGKGYVKIDAAEGAKQTGLTQDAGPSGVILPGSSRRWSVGVRPAIADRATFQRIAAGISHASQQHLAQELR